MKKITLFLFVTLLFSSSSVYSQSTKLEKALRDILTAVKESNYKILNVGSQTLSVNSTTNIGGHTREFFKLTLPEGTKKYALRVTVIPIKSNFQYEPDETLFALMQKNNAKEVYAPQDKGIDLYIMNRSFEADAFVNKGNFKFVKEYPNFNSFVEQIDSEAGNYWIGVKNPNSMNGLKTIVEIVAIGNF